VASNGFEGETESSYFGVTASVSIKWEGEARPESYWYDSSIDFDMLQKEGIGAKALERALSKLGQKKIKSGTYKMLLDNITSSQMVSPLLNAITGFSIQQKSSFLLDKIGEKVLGENVTFVDEPHMVGVPGARYFDNEGVATKRLPIFEDGVLKTYFIDTYYGKKLDVAPTISSPSIVTMRMGEKNLEELTVGIDKGIYVTGFNGGNSNPTTGDFSYGVEGFLIENGKKTKPISEMNVTGNFITLWNNLIEAGNDPRQFTSRRIPSLLFDKVDFSGL
jgi:PmbA protein